MRLATEQKKQKPRSRLGEELEDPTVGSTSGAPSPARPRILQLGSENRRQNSLLFLHKKSMTPLQVRRRQTLMEVSREKKHRSLTERQLSLSGFFDNPFGLPEIPQFTGRNAKGSLKVDPALVISSKADLEISIDEGGRVDMDSIKLKDDDFIPHQFLEPVIPTQPADSTPITFDQSVSVPHLNIVIMLCGSRGDVQPFLAFGNALVEKGHRVRVATHDLFRDFVVKNGLEFYPIGGDPRALMEHMVKNPSIMPGSLDEIQESRENMRSIMYGCWDAVIDPISVLTTEEEEQKGIEKVMPPWQTHAIVSNPATFGHYHVAERLGVPLHIFFTMPWSPTKEFPHPLSNMSYKKRTARRNLFSYYLVDTLTWTGLGDMGNALRTKTLGLPAITATAGQTLLHYSQVPHAYIWSPNLIPKPRDWGSHIDITGFFFLSLANQYTPPPEIAQFFESGPPPIYLGFGSIVLDSPREMTRIILEAFEETGYRGIISRGWSGLGEGFEIPDSILLIGDCPHDWLFPRVAAVCHHGGAGTSAAGLRAGKPTIIYPFFGDQPFWGQMVANRKVGPHPIPAKEITAENLAEAFRFVMQPKTQKLAAELGEKMDAEKGIDIGIDVFHAHLPLKYLRCDVDPKSVAVIYCFDCDLCMSAEVHAVIHPNQESSTHRWFRYGSSNWNPQIFLPGVHHVVAGVAGGITESLMLVPKLFLEPWRGLRSGGIPGFFHGLWHGIKGVFVYPYRGIIIFVREIRSGMFTPSWHHNKDIHHHGRYILVCNEMEDPTQFKGKWMELEDYFVKLNRRAQQGEKIGAKLPKHSGNPILDSEDIIPEQRKTEIQGMYQNAMQGRLKRWEEAPVESEEKEINVPMALCLTMIGLVLVTLAYSVVLQLAMGGMDG